MSHKEITCTQVGNNKKLDMVVEIAEKVKMLLDNDLTRDLQTDYEQLATLVKSYRGRTSVQTVQDALVLVGKELDLPDYEDEILVDISCRLSGFCPKHIQITWY